MTSRIPTSPSERSYAGSITGSAALDTNAVPQGQHVVDVPADSARTQAANQNKRDAAALQPSYELLMNRELMSHKTYLEAMRGADSFRDAMNITQSFLAAKKAALLQAAKTADPVSAARATKAAADIGESEAEVAGFCMRSDTLDIYMHCSPKLG